MRSSSNSQSGAKQAPVGTKTKQASTTPQGFYDSQTGLRKNSANKSSTASLKEPLAAGS